VASKTILPQSRDCAEHHLRVRTLRVYRLEATRPVVREVDQLLVERPQFRKMPRRSLADSAYFGNECPAGARQHEAKPLHAIKRSARHLTMPETNYQKMVSSWRHWPNRAAARYRKRNHAETTFSIIGGRFGHRIPHHSDTGRKNEVSKNFIANKVLMLAWMSLKSAD